MLTVLSHIRWILLFAIRWLLEPNPFVEDWSVEQCRALRLGANKLYISSHSSKESQEAYHALGCRHAEEINEILAEKEPFDVQLEYVL